MGTEFPLVLGVDGAGRVEALGAGAGRFAVGDLVHGQFWGDTVGRGTFAERIAIAERPSHGALELVPEGLEPGLAAAVPTAGMTAEGALAKTGCGPGQTLLILGGAAGGVGILAAQLAARAGITVIATARGEAGAWIEGFGASQTIDYTQRPLAEALAEAHPDGIDAVLDLVGDAGQLTAAAQHVRDGERSSRRPSASPPSFPATTASPQPTTSLTTSLPARARDRSARSRATGHPGPGRGHTRRWRGRDRTPPLRRRPWQDDHPDMKLPRPTTSPAATEPTAPRFYRPEEEQNASSPGGKHKATFWRFHDAFANGGDAEFISKMIDDIAEPGVTNHTPVEATGAQVLKELFARIHRVFPDLKVTVEDMIEEGDKVAGQNTLTGTHHGEYMGLPPTGKIITYNEIIIFRFVNGRIAETWGVVDVFSQMKQLGMIPA